MGGERLGNRLPEAKESRREAAVNSPSPFGRNEWLVEEMYRKFREDPSSVDPSWHEFLVDYSPEPTADTRPTGGNGQPAQARGPAPTTPPEPAPAPAPKPQAGNGASAPAKPKQSDPAPSKPEQAPAKPKTAAPPTADGEERQVLRGAAAAVVKNMSA